MSNWRRYCGGAILAVLLSFGVFDVASAGGWAVVTLDMVPQRPQAGQTLSLGFMVRQHGTTPIDGAYNGATMAPILTARNSATGEILSAIARKEGPVGHFVVDVTFPSAGEWAWKIAPEPFAPTDLGTLTILPSGAASSQLAPGLPVPAASTATLDPASVTGLRAGLRWAAIALLLCAFALVLWGQRTTLVRHGRAAR